jgi:hypothetical protein
MRRIVQPLPSQKPPLQPPSTQPQPIAEQAVRRAAVQPSPLSQNAPPHALFAQAQPNCPQSLACWAPQPSFTQRPALAQVAHAAPTLTHWLLALHTCGCAPVQIVVPGSHTHCPAPRQIGVSPEHAVSFRHKPAFVHTFGVLPAQVRVPGTHAPPQVPLAGVHTKLQAVGVLHCPVTLQVRNARVGVPATHSILPGTHTPAHAPFTQALGHAVGAPH